jgi:hypothetical protein
MNLTKKDREALRRAAHRAAEELNESKHNQDMPAMQDWQRIREEVRRETGGKIDEQEFRESEAC